MQLSGPPQKYLIKNSNTGFGLFHAITSSPGEDYVIYSSYEIMNVSLGWFLELLSLSTEQGMG